MANKYTWSVDSLDCIPSFDGQTNVVSVVHWRVIGTDGINKAIAYSTQSLTYTADVPFTAYESLTENTVIEWVHTAMGSEQVKTIQISLDNQLTDLENPPIVTPPLPWGNV